MVDQGERMNITLKGPESTTEEKSRRGDCSVLELSSCNPRPVKSVSSANKKEEKKAMPETPRGSGFVIHLAGQGIEDPKVMYSFSIPSPLL